MCWNSLAAPALAADPAKTLRVVLTSAEQSFDPQFSADGGSDGIIDHIYDSMLDYDYLVRPMKLVPRTLEAMPTVEAGGATYVFKLKRGIFFTPDPAFNGKPRELTAADQAYALKRLLDPAVKSPWLWMIEGKIIGADEVRAQALKSGKFDYDAPIAGLEVVDRYTLRIRLKRPDLRFPYVFAVPNTAAVAREVVETYGRDFGAHPVGTGPYMLGEYRRSAKIVLLANPGFRDTTYVPAGAVPPEAVPIAAALKGKKLPLVGRIEISVIVEGQAVWLAFVNRELDLLERLPPEFVDEALADGVLRPELAAKGIRHEAQLRPNTRWTYFNMEDPVVGGYTPEKIALRRAIGMGYDVKEFIRVILKGRAVPATSPIPPDIAGYDPLLKTSAQLYDPAAARALLDRFGYKDRDGDGYREMPDGKPLVLERWSAPTSLTRQEDEQWKKNMDAIGLRIEFRKDALQELRKNRTAGKDANAHRWLERRLPRRRKLHAAALRAERRTGKPRPVQLAGIRQALRRRISLAGFARTHAAVRPDDRTGCRLRALAADGAPNGGPSAAALDPELQAAPGANGAVALPRHRPGAASEIKRRYSAEAGISGLG